MIDINDYECFSDYCIAKEEEAKEERLMYSKKTDYERYLDSIPYAPPGSGLIFDIPLVECSGVYYG